MNSKSYIISVSLGTGCYRHIKISGKATLEEFSDAILEAFEFDNDHLHAFFMSNRAWDNFDCYYSPYADNGYPSSANIKLQFASLEIGKKFLYIFDFGDEWQFSCKVLNVLYEDTKSPEIVRSKGEAPHQYPDYDGELFDDEYYDENSDDSNYTNEICEPEELPVPVPDELYDAALRFRKVKLWSKLKYSDIFAVKLSDGEIGYCCIMGNLGEYYALSLYVGNEGLLSYYHIVSPPTKYFNEEQFERMLSQNCIQVCFENKDDLRPADLNSIQDYTARKNLRFRGAYSYPVILRATPYYVPWFIKEEKDFSLLREALEATIFVSEKLKDSSAKKLGFTTSAAIPYLIPNNDGYEWSTLTLPDKMTEKLPETTIDPKTADKLKKLKQLNKWECKVTYLNTPVQDSADEIPYFPAVLIAVECRNDYLLNIEPVRDYSVNAQMLLDRFAEELLKYKRLPKTICVSDERTYLLLSSFCSKLGIELKRTDSLSKIEAIVDKMNDINSGNEFEDLMHMMDLLEELSVDELKTMPPELRESCKQMMQEGLFEKDIESKLKRAFNIK